MISEVCNNMHSVVLYSDLLYHIILVRKEPLESILSMIKLHIIDAASRFRACCGEVATTDSICWQLLKAAHSASNSNCTLYLPNWEWLGRVGVAHWR